MLRSAPRAADMLKTSKTSARIHMVDRNKCCTYRTPSGRPRAKDHLRFANCGGKVLARGKVVRLSLVDPRERLSTLGLRRPSPGLINELGDSFCLRLDRIYSRPYRSAAAYRHHLRRISKVEVGYDPSLHYCFTRCERKAASNASADGTLSLPRAPETLTDTSSLLIPSNAAVSAIECPRARGSRTRISSSVSLCPSGITPEFGDRAMFISCIARLTALFCCPRRLGQRKLSVRA